MTHAPRVLLISARKSPLLCGIADYTAKLTQSHRKLGIEAEHLGLDTEFFSGRMNGARIAYALNKCLHESWDLIHLQYEAFSFGQSLVLPLYLASHRIPLAITFHEVFHRHSLDRQRDALLARSARLLIVNDRRCEEALRTLVPGVHISRIGVGSNIPAVSNPSSFRPGLIGYFGFLNAVKNLRLVLDVFAVLAEENPHRTLRLIGAIDRDSNEARALDLEIKSRGLNQRVEWTGAITPEQAAASIADCEVMLLPFTDGASPRRGSLQACLAAGKAIVTTPALLQESSLNGLQMLVLDVSLWTTVVRSILEQPDLRRSLERRAVEIAKDFSWMNISQRHKSLYFDTIKKS